MKKKYFKPKIETVRISQGSLLAASPGGKYDVDVDGSKVTPGNGAHEELPDDIDARTDNGQWDVWE